MTDAVVVLDRSVQMPMRDWYLPARQGASLVARHISSGSSHRLRGIIGFAESAAEIHLDELDEVDFEHVYGTNLMAAIALGQELLDHQPGRLVTFSSFEPSAHTTADGFSFFSYPPVAASLAATLGQLRSARGEDILVDAFCFDTIHLDQTKAVLSAISENGGRVAYVEAGNCEDTVRVYLERLWT
ncbi:MAG TPA: hypothetical protein VLX59_14670 [Acidimicrobiales bacterium]|nr:hypothetical protein [Acidimicrobiales bacterium]